MITVSLMGIVEMPVYQVANMISVGHRFMATARSVDVVVAMCIALVAPGTSTGILLAHFQLMLVVMAFMGMMEVPVVKVIDVVLVLNGGMSAIGAMFMVVILVFFTAHRYFLLVRKCVTPTRAQKVAS